ncbi:B12-binding domain-containing radical SAM protein [Labilibaculum euxinus]|uniref:Radical SAM protein n=1 Tax=Labilibaculum euxinus TaxID=2686357 RepID=A0A7M4D0Z2_9BACT|nr:radical SAM protein [Labilibaculum euxinus]MUP36321.1 radical SAM protein [Labilibaculum euxinus]MVB05526.1 radical SAM protein [Labilibaculum euxinus]
MNNLNFTMYSLPPIWSNLPIAGLSCISSFLNSHEIKTRIEYLNLYFEKEISCFKQGQPENEILFFFTLMLERMELAEKFKIERIKIFVESSYPRFFLTEKTYSDELYYETEQNILSIIDKSIDRIELESPILIGFTSKFNQWIPATLVAKMLKIRNPKIKTVIGGWTNKKAAIDFLAANENFDYAIWGEGEISILELINSLKEDFRDHKLSLIPRLIYREDGQIKTSSTNDSIVDLNFKTQLDFDDYFKTLKDLKYTPQNILLPVESSRGCHWNKCEFCYLNQGYKYRRKSNEQVIFEIKRTIEKYRVNGDVFSFSFMDNDIIGKDLNKFDDFLFQLGDIKKANPDFEIRLAEVVTSGLNSDSIRKMSESGFKSVQIGLEAISPKLLKKINKEQTFSENLFFLTEAVKNNITVNGANIIYNTLDESEEDLLESIENIYFLRFLTKKVEFSIIPLGVANHSRYLKRIQNSNQEGEWNNSSLAYLSNEKFTKSIDRFSLFDYTTNLSRSPLWNIFERNLDFYSQNNIRYNVKYNQQKDGFTYREYFGRRKVKDIVFEDSRYINLFKLLSTRTFSIDELLIDFEGDFNELSNILSDLKDEGLVYYSDNYQGITSIIRI